MSERVQSIVQAVRVVRFCAGHRVHRHESKCRNLHGHNYEAHLYAQGTTRHLDPIGRVIDFSVLKDCVGGWIETHWDHGMVLYDADREALAAVAGMLSQKLYKLPVNPTAENMADHLLRVVGPLVLAEHRVELVQVDLWETPNCMARVSL